MMNTTLTQVGLVELQRERLQRVASEREALRRRSAAERRRTAGVTLGVATLATGAAAMAVVAQLLGGLITGYGWP